MAFHLRGHLSALAGAALIGGGSLLLGYSIDAFLTNTAKPELSELKLDKESILPEAATGFLKKDSVEADDYMMVAAHPAAAQAGAQVLDRGGSALDAIIAAQMVLNLVEPQSSGIGGGGFMLYWDAEGKRLHTYDGRETAPAAVDRRLFKHPNGSDKTFMEAVVGGASIGVPGLLKMFQLARDTHGGMPLSTLFAPAVDLAQNGFPLSPRLYQLLAAEKYISPGMKAYDYFYRQGGTPHSVGDILKNPAFAKTLQTIARDGFDAFYAGDIARDVVHAARSAPGNPGGLAASDLATYQAKQRPNLCSSYRRYKVCGMPPPSSGGLTVQQILGMIEPTDLSDLEPDSPKAIQTVVEAMRLAFADRALYIADSDFADVPVKGLLNKGYLHARSLEMSLTDAQKGPAQHGYPPEGQANAYEPGQSPELPSTTHMVAVDKDGNAASITTSIENAFGSRQMARGFLLNNQLTDFSRDANRNGVPVRNRIEPGKRPRSSMAPTMVFDEEGELVLLLGSPGGSRIIGYVATTLLAILDWDMDPQEAVSMPHYLSRNHGLELEAGTDMADLKDAMRERGYKVRIGDMNSGLHAIAIEDDDTLVSGVDPRREGYAIGEGNLLPDVRSAFDIVLPDTKAAEADE